MSELVDLIASEATKCIKDLRQQLQSAQQEIERLKEVQDQLYSDRNNAEMNLAHMTNLFESAVEVLKQIYSLTQQAHVADNAGAYHMLYLEVPELIEKLLPEVKEPLEVDENDLPF